MALDVPEPVRNRAVAEGHTEWLHALPELLADVARQWGLTPGRPFAEGTAAYVCEAAADDGTEAILKLAPPPDAGDIEREAAVLRLADGNGCARLLREDRARNVLLLERLGPSLHRLGLPVRQRHAILADTASRLWRPLSPESAEEAGLVSGRAKARWLIDYIETEWERLGRPCSEAAVEHALDCGARRIAAHDEARAVLVHGDVHQWNTLRTLDGSSFKLVDPDGLVAEAEYDLGIIMREDPVELVAEGSDPWERAEFLADRTGLDPIAAWEWGVIERVSNGLGALTIHMQPEADQILRAADVIAARHRSPLR